MPFFKLTLAYDGTAFAGWQIQPGCRTVQGTLEQALAKVTSQRVRAVASGRTDAGVHALGQVVSITTTTHLAPKVLQRALNANLPDDIVVLELVPARDGFHAIRDTYSKRYRYLIQDGPHCDLFIRHYSWHVFRPLSVGLMQQGAQVLVGRHDFCSFQASGSRRKSTVRNVTHLSVIRRLGDLASQVVLEIEADGFLYNMVRNIVGTLVEVGRGDRPAHWVQEVLSAKDRALAGPTAPPQGLFLVHALCRHEVT